MCFKTFRYELEVCKDDCDEITVEYSGISLNTTVYNLQPNTQYKFRITSFNSVGSRTSQWSQYKTYKEGSLEYIFLLIIVDMCK